MKSRAKELGISDVRVNNAGCLERCEFGPTMVIYPDGVWYRYDSQADIDEILESHIIADRPVERLMLKDGQKFPKFATTELLKLLVADIQCIGKDLRRIEFVAPDSQVLPAFSAGSYLTLLIDNDRLRRCYTLANNPDERNRYVIYVKKSASGRGGADWLHSNLEVGTAINARPPENTFPLDESAKQYVLVSDGIGVVPFLAMSDRLRVIKGDFKLHHFADSNASKLLFDELHKQSGEKGVCPEAAKGWASSQSLIDTLQSYTQGRHLYICGSRALVQDVTQMASDWPEYAIHTHSFEPERLDTASQQGFNVTLARRQKTIRINANETILDALHDLDLPLDYGCKEGLCGACKVKVLHGKVEHRDSVLATAQKTANDTMLTCVSRAAKDESRLVLDI